MPLSRREFMRAGVATVVCGVLPLKSVLGQKTESLLSSKVNPDQLDYYTQSSFAPYLNTQFLVYLDESSTRELKLIGVSDYLGTLSGPAPRGNPHRIECFSLLLTLPPGRSFEQDTYLIEHEALGTFYMFLVPVGQRVNRGLDYYEAVVYRHPGLPRGYEAAFSNDIGPGRPQAVPGGPPPQVGSEKLKTSQEVFYFRPQAIEQPAVPAVDPGADGRRAAAQMTLSQTPGIGGLKLGMTIEQALALFPGIKNDGTVRSSLSKPPNPFGVQTLLISPEKYSTRNRFERVSQITLTFLDGRLFSLNVGYQGQLWAHVDGFVTKFSGQASLPGSASWDSYDGLNTQLKTLKGRDFEINVFAGGDNVNIDYVQMLDTAAHQKLKDRLAKAAETEGITP